jgi:hypothetical protein
MQEAAMSANKVVVKYKDGTIRKGQTSNFFPNKTSFHLQPLKGGGVEVTLEELKAIFFVKDFDGSREHRKVYTDEVPGGGRKLRVTFRDGETMIGFTTGYTPDRPGFYLVPADLKGNNERVYVVKSATVRVEAA